MRKTKSVVWSAIWLALLAALGLNQLVFAPRDERFSENENRTLAGFPAFSGESLLDGGFTGGLESWMLDSFPLRSGAIGFSQQLRDDLSFAGYDDYLAVMQAAEDPLAGREDGPGAPVEPPPPPAPPAASSSLPPAAGEPDPNARRPVTFAQKPPPNNADWPAAMGVFMQADGQTSTLESFGFEQVTAAADRLNQIARLLPKGGAMAFTMVPQSMFTNRFVNAADRTALYSDFEDCVAAYTDDNVLAFSTTDILGRAIMRGEYVYFRTDMHWTPYGTWLVYAEMARTLGFAPTPWEDYDTAREEPFLGTYYRDNPTSYMRDNADYLDLVTPAEPYTYRRLAVDGTLAEAPLLDDGAYANDRYTVYLGGPGPWSVIESDNEREQNCLVLCDSFGLAFVPLLAGQYKQVHYYDPRYFSAGAAGGSLSELIARYDITDCYVVVGDLHCFGSDFLAQAVWQI